MSPESFHFLQFPNQSMEVSTLSHRENHVFFFPLLSILPFIPSTVACTVTFDSSEQRKEHDGRVRSQESGWPGTFSPLSRNPRYPKDTSHILYGLLAEIILLDMLQKSDRKPDLWVIVRRLLGTYTFSFFSLISNLSKKNIFCIHRWMRSFALFQGDNQLPNLSLQKCDTRDESLALQIVRNAHVAKRGWQMLFPVIFGDLYAFYMKSG